MRDIQAIVFDKDGTLFDFEATWTPWAEKFFLRMCNGDRQLAHKKGTTVGFNLMNGVFERDSIVIAGTPEEIVDGLAPLFPEYSATEIVEIVNAEAESAPMAETVPVLPFLQDLKKRGLKLGVATNDAEAPARAHLEAVGVLNTFDFVAGSDSGYGGKPSPGQLKGFCESVGVRPENSAMVGDSLHDLKAGHAAGFYRIGVLTGLATRDELEPFADVVLDHIGLIPAILDKA